MPPQIKRLPDGKFQPGTAPGPGRPKTGKTAAAPDLPTLVALAQPPTAEQLAAAELDLRELLVRAGTPPDQIENEVANYHRHRLATLHAAQDAVRRAASAQST